MPDKNLSVDDILGEIELSRAKAAHRLPPDDLQHIDDVIRDILTQKQEEELRQEHRELTEKEKLAYQKEIEVQTRNLTEQFEKLKREKQRASQPPVEAPPVEPPPPEPRETAPPAEQVPPAQERREEPPPPKAPPRVGAGLGDIGGHFGNFKMEDASVEESYAKTDISLKNYKEFKSSRNKKVDSFVLGPKEAPPGEAEEDETAAVQREAERRLHMEEVEGDSFEYRSPDQAEQVGGSLREVLRSLRTTLIVLGALSVNVFLLAFVKPGEAGLSLLGRFPVSPLIYAVINLVLLAAALAAGGGIFKETADRLQRHQPTKNLLCLAAVAACLAVNVVYCFTPLKLMSGSVHLYTPVAVLLLLFNRAARYQDVSRALGNFRFVSAEGERYAVAHVDDLRVSKNMTKGVLDNEPVLVKNVKAGFLDHFLAHSFHSDAGDLLAQRVLVAALPLGVVLAVVGWFLTKDLYQCMTVFSGTMVLATGFLSAVVVSFPLHDSTGVVERFSGMMPSWDVIEDVQNVNALLIDGCALFPAGSVALRGIKTFQGGRVDDAIIDAASVVCAANSALKEVFLEIIGRKLELLRPVDTLQYEDLMGLSAWVNERRVLIGNRELMINHSIAVPKKDYEDKHRAEGNELIYLATGGELAAAFLLDFTPEQSVADVVRLLDKNGVAAVVKSVDSCITPELLGRLFGMEPTMFKVLPSRLHKEYDDETAPCERVDSMLGNDGSLFGYIVSLAAAKKLFSCVRLGKILYLASAVCGIALLSALLLLHGLAGFGAAQMVLFLGIFPLAYWFYEKNMHI